jgi:hypothetical protein
VRASRSDIERERRRWIESLERFEDAREDLEQALASAPTKEDERRIRADYAKVRTRYRLEEEKEGRRGPGVTIKTWRCMWALWMQLADRNERQAQHSYQSVAEGYADGLIEELRSSLFAVTSYAYAIEALYEDVRYRIGEVEGNRRDEIIIAAFRKAFRSPTQRLSTELEWLFDLRNSAVHGFSDFEPTARHPTGLYSATEHSRYNAVACARAGNLAHDVMVIAEAPAASSPRWIQRWAKNRAMYFDEVKALNRDRPRDWEPTGTRWE